MINNIALVSVAKLSHVRLLGTGLQYHAPTATLTVLVSRF